MTESELVEKLGGLEVGDHVRVTVDDGETFTGSANPIDYVPESSLRVEVRPEGGSTERYEISTDYDGGWADLSARRSDASDEDTGWNDIGTVTEVEVGDDADDWDWGTSAE